MGKLDNLDLIKEAKAAVAGVKEAQSCDCIKDAEQNIKEELPAYLVRVENFGIQRSEVRIVPFRKDGQPSKVSHYMSLYWNYCPFCGEHIDGRPDGM